MGAFRNAMAGAGSPDIGGAMSLAMAWPSVIALAFAGYLSLAAIVAAAVQGGIVFAPGKLAPDLARLNPAKYFGRLVTVPGLIELAKAALKIVVVAIVAWKCARSALEAASHARSAAAAMTVLAASVRRLLYWCAAIAVTVAAADYGHKLFEYEADLRMTRQEFLDELKQEEGNPLIKRAIRRRQRANFKRIRGIHQAATASVVLTNPTHYAVALRYRRGFDQAPLVVAKGAGDAAHRIVGIARMAGVTVMENKILARALFRAVEPGDLIPRQFYRAVAEVLAMIMRAQARTRAAAGV